MTVALLCPGPSLPLEWSDELFDEFECVVGVNTATHRFNVHWGFGVDAQVMRPILDKKVRQPLVGMVTNNGWGNSLYGRGLSTRHPDMYAGRRCPQKPQEILGKAQCLWTMPNALLFALDQAGSGKVHIYGWDASPTPDFTRADGQHDPGRWIEEAIWLRSIWQPTIIAHGRASDQLRSFVSGSSDTLTVEGRSYKWPDRFKR